MTEVHGELLAEVRHYQMPASAVELLKAQPPLIIASVSAGGKTSIAAEIVKQSNYSQVVTHTTRLKRPDEVNGVDYWFVSESKMLELIRQKAFLEVKAIHGDLIYGVSLAAYQLVVKKNLQPLLILDVQGAQDIIKRFPKTDTFFIVPPDYETWMRRLESRGQMSFAEKARRLQSARQEIQTALNDAHFTVVINHQIAATAQEILGGPMRVNQRANREVAQNLIDQISP